MKKEPDSTPPGGKGKPGPEAHLQAEAETRRRLERENKRLRGDLRTLCRRISHDLRTPLASISATSGALGNLSPGPDSPLAGFARSIDRSVAEIVRLSDRVNFVLRATADPPSGQPLAMGDIVDAALDKNQERIRERRAKVVRPDSWPAVEGVPEWLEVIWSDLVANALEHTESAPHLVLGWMPTREQYRFWVRDHGPGIPPNRQPGLFKPFDLLHELDSPRGLGLSIVQRLVDLQGGECSFDFPSGGGCRLSFTLPAN